MAMVLLACILITAKLVLLPKEASTAFPELLNMYGKIAHLGLPDSPCYPEVLRWTDFEEETWPCGEEQCLCTESVAFCRDRRDVLVYIPRLPRSIEFLRLFSTLTISLDRDFLVNVTNITHLDVSACHTDYIAAGTFDLFTNLTHIDLSATQLEYDSLESVLSVTTLKKLDLSANGLGHIPNDLFSAHRFHQLHTLCFGANKIHVVDMSTFEPLTGLRALDLGYNHLSSETFLTENVYLPQLRYLNLMPASFHSFPQTCYKSKSVFPNLRELAVEGAAANIEVKSEFGRTEICLPSLQDLWLIESSPFSIEGDTFSADSFPSLLTLRLQKGPGPDVEKHAFRNPKLRELVLNSVQIDFSSPSVDADCFAGCPSLSILVLNTNDFAYVSDAKFNRLFSQVPALVSLDLTSCHISHVNAYMFSGLQRLEILYLGYNRITYLQDGIFDGLVNLTELSLINNRLEIIKEATFSFTTRQLLTVLDLEGNPFVCSCELLWFQWWTTTDSSVEFGGPHECDNMNTTVQAFYVAEQSCLLSPQESKFIIATTVLVFLFFFLSTSVYRYRWHLRLVFFEAFRGQEDRLRRQRRLQQHFQYDVFVSYDKKDLHWVRDHLMPKLETAMGLKLCVHERDFIPGNLIVDNIDDCVKASKKVMMLFSSNFAKSQWCQFELALCLSHVMEHGDSLLIVLLHDIPSRDMTSAMMAVMKTTTYIEWGQGPEAQDSFWRRMHIALDELLP